MIGNASSNNTNTEHKPDMQLAFETKLQKNAGCSFAEKLV